MLFVTGCNIDLFESIATIKHFFKKLHKRVGSILLKRLNFPVLHECSKMEFGVSNLFFHLQSRIFWTYICIKLNSIFHIIVYCWVFVKSLQILLKFVCFHFIYLTLPHQTFHIKSFHPTFNSHCFSREWKKTCGYNSFNRSRTTILMALLIASNKEST